MTMPMAMAKYWSFEALDAVAEVDVIEGKLIAGLRIEANAAAEQGSNTARELQPRCLFDQRHLIDPKRCRCLGTPVAPDVSADIRLPHLTVVAVDSPHSTQAEPAGLSRGRAEPDGA
jgi:hypothetical protein